MKPAFPRAVSFTPHHPPPPPDLECVFQIKMGLGVHWYAFSLGDGTDVIRSDLLPFARITVLEGLWFRTQPGLLIFMLSLAFLLFKVEDEADIFYLYIGVYILQQRPPVFAYCNPLFLVGCVCGRVRVLVEGLTARI